MILFLQVMLLECSIHVQHLYDITPNKFIIHCNHHLITQGIPLDSRMSTQPHLSPGAQEIKPPLRKQDCHATCPITINPRSSRPAPHVRRKAADWPSSAFLNLATSRRFSLFHTLTNVCRCCFSCSLILQQASKKARGESNQEITGGSSPASRYTRPTSSSAARSSVSPENKATIRSRANKRIYSSCSGVSCFWPRLIIGQGGSWRWSFRFL